MNPTDQVREWYHDGVVLNHASRGTSGYQPECQHNWPLIGFPGEGVVTYFEPVHPYTWEAWEAYILVMVTMGVTITSAGGVNSCRNIAGTNEPSLHAYLLALDNPPNERKPDAFITAIEAIRTNDGAQVFRNLGFVNDRMHDEVNCSPTNLASGIDWSTVFGFGGDEVAFADFIEDIQNDLNTLGYTDKEGNPVVVDGKWGAKTRQAFREMMRKGKGEKGDKGDKGDPGDPVGLKITGKITG